MESLQTRHDTRSKKVSAESSTATKHQPSFTVEKPTAQVQPLRAQSPSKPDKPEAVVTSGRATASVSLREQEEEGDTLYANTGRPQSCVRITDLHRYIQQEKSENPNTPFQREFTVSII